MYIQVSERKRKANIYEELPACNIKSTKFHIRMIIYDTYTLGSFEPFEWGGWSNFSCSRAENDWRTRLQNCFYSFSLRLFNLAYIPNAFSRWFLYIFFFFYHHFITFYHPKLLAISLYPLVHNNITLIIKHDRRYTSIFSIHTKKKKLLAWNK